MTTNILLGEAVELPVPKFYCRKELKRNEFKSVYCLRLDQWVSVRLCLQCSEKKVVPTQ